MKMSNKGGSQFVVTEDLMALDEDYKYMRIALYVPIYSLSLITHRNGKAVDFNLKEAKRELIRTVFKDLMETEDWYEENQDRHQGLASGAGSND